MIWYTYTLRKNSHHWVNTSISSYIYLSLVKKIKFYSLSKFQYNYINLYSTVLSPTITMLYISSSALIHPISKSLYPFTNLPLISLPLRHPGNNHSTLCFYVLALIFFKIAYIKDTMQYFSLSVWLISLSIMPTRFIHVVTNGRIFFFLKAE